MPRNSFTYDGKLVPLSRELRKNMTRQERHLWYDFLRSYPVKIYRQREILGFIADFYCPAAKLVIELDGNQHYTEDGLAYDAKRTKALSDLGIQVIRFSNLQIDREFCGVCCEINRIITVRKS